MLLLRETAYIFQRNLNTVCPLRVTESRLTWWNVFIVDLLSLGGQKNSNMMKEPSVRAPSGVLICLLKIILTNRLLLETDFLDRFKEFTSEIKLVFFLQDVATWGGWNFNVQRNWFKLRKVIRKHFNSHHH